MGPGTGHPPNPPRLNHPHPVSPPLIRRRGFIVCATNPDVAFGVQGPMPTTIDEGDLVSELGFEAALGVLRPANTTVLECRRRFPCAQFTSRRRSCVVVPPPLAASTTNT
jgi:hypothetical protein